MKRALIVLLVVAVVMVGGVYALVVLRPSVVQPAVEAFEARVLNQQGATASQELTGGAEGFDALGDAVPSAAEEAAEQDEWLRQHRTRLIAQASGVDFRCPVATEDLTGILFHQASFAYALPFTTELPEANYEWVEAHRTIPVNRDQQEGEWLDAEALHLWRTSDATPMETSIDVGAAAGTVVRSPISGKVVLVKDYMLYDQVPDIEIHIQPDGKPDLDCVLIHTSDPLVSAGEHVDAGLTEVCHVRDIEKDLTDVQLSFFTPEGVGGNHVHVQLNDATTKGYRSEKLKGAVQ